MSGRDLWYGVVVMGIHRSIRRSERRFLMVWFVIVLLVVSAVQVPFAVTKIRSRMSPPPTRAVFLMGTAAAEHGWPAGLPAGHVWPAPESVTIRRAFGHASFEAKTASPTPGVNGFSMQVQRLGWPLPVIEIKQMWWDWNDPALGDPANGGPEPDPRPGLLPLGLVLNPLLVGLPLWLLFFGLPMAWVVVRRVRRLRRGACLWCGYDLVGLKACPECGRDTEFRAERA
jgi:hypothetical protein